MNPEELLSQLTPDQIDTVLAERDLYHFVKLSWPQIEPGVAFHDNWHIKAMCEHLQAVTEGKITRLIINIPPRHMKSTVVSVCWPVWSWITTPHRKFLAASYAQALSTRDAVKSRRLLNSQWFKERWDGIFTLTGDQNQKQRYENNQTGYRIATSVDGGLTGEGGDIIMIDDPHNVRDAESEQTRTNTLEWWDQALPSRLNDPKTGAFVIIMQRVHEKDLVGHILKGEEERLSLPGEKPLWDILCFPARYEPDHPTPIRSSLGFKDPRTTPGELLWPSRFDEAALKRLEFSLGEYGTAGQLQQRPSPRGGGIMKRKWWRPWEKTSHPQFIYVLQSWDTAFTEKKTGAYSACTTWGVFQYASSYHIMIMHRFRDHLDYPSLRSKSRELYDEYAPDAVLIEKKASGQSLVQDLKQMGIPILTYQPDRDKIARAHAASALLESGIVWYPDRKWAQEVIHHCAVFPAGDGADIVDTVTQALIRLRQMWYAEPPSDQGWDPRQEERDDPFDTPSNVIELQGPIYG